MEREGKTVRAGKERMEREASNYTHSCRSDSGEHSENANITAHCGVYLQLLLGGVVADEVVIDC